MTTVYARRRLMCLWLPFIVMGMTVYLWSFTQTTTINGLGLLGLVVTGIGVLASALDAGDES